AARITRPEARWPSTAYTGMGTITGSFLFRQIGKIAVQTRRADLRPAADSCWARQFAAIRTDDDHPNPPANQASRRRLHPTALKNRPTATGRMCQGEKSAKQPYQSRKRKQHSPFDLSPNGLWKTRFEIS